MRASKRTGLLAVLILLAAGHVGYWYWPRERQALPRTGSLPASLLASDQLPLRTWVAYPHQNLAFLANGESGKNWRRGLSDLVGVPEIELPSFGPFPLPPSSELAVATDADGERLVVAAQIYPLMALVARAAGKLAGNPWLAGGEIYEGGRTLEVAWQGRTWLLRTPGEKWPDATQPREFTESDYPALARLAFEQPLGPLPSGEYRLSRSGRHLDLVSAAAAVGELSRPPRGVLMHAERLSTGLRATVVLGPGEGSLRGVPSAVCLAEKGVKLPRLPFQRLYRVLGIKRKQARRAGWRLAASDRGALARGWQLLPTVEQVAGQDARQESYAVDLDMVREVSAEIERQLEGLSLPAIREVRVWRGAARILEELGAYDRWSLEIGADDAVVRSRVWFADEDGEEPLRTAESEPPSVSD